jgi:CubicO group peptidase (beta-lactamase class C family)
MTLIATKIKKNLSSAFEKNFSDGLECGASVALYQRGEKIISLHQGWCDEAHSKPWEATTLATLWSTGKGIAAACILHALQQRGISLQEKVAAFWPEFAQAGKEKITIAQLLSHQAGLAALDQKGIVLTDHVAVVEALAAQPPNWLLDGRHGYGARTFGFLVDELLRRVSQEPSLAHYWRHFFADPFELDLWFGVPEKELSRVADIIPSKVPPLPSPFGSAYADQTSLTRRAFFEPGGGFPTRAMNHSELRQAAIISSGAIGSAEALAKFYSLITMREGNPWFTPETQAWMQQSPSCGKDHVFLEETRFSAGFMMNCKNIMGRNPSSFGHPGAGGTLAFGDPALEIGFAFVPNAMQLGVLSAERTQRLVDTLC